MARSSVISATEKPSKPHAKSPGRRLTTYKIIQAIIGILFAGFLLYRIYVVFIETPSYGADTWARFIIAGAVDSLQNVFSTKNAAPLCVKPR